MFCRSRTRATSATRQVSKTPTKKLTASAAIHGPYGRGHGCAWTLSPIRGFATGPYAGPKSLSTCNNQADNKGYCLELQLTCYTHTLMWMAPCCTHPQFASAIYLCFAEVSHEPHSQTACPQAVLCKLDSLRDICSARSVCHQWQRCTESVRVWSELRDVRLGHTGAFLHSADSPQHDDYAQRLGFQG